MTDIDWKNIFKPSDFDDFLPFRIKADNSDEQETANSVAAVAEFYFKQQLASTANARFRELVAEHGKKVWGNVGTASSSWTSYPPGALIMERTTHKAFLIMEEEIK